MTIIEMYIKYATPFLITIGRFCFSCFHSCYTAYFFSTLHSTSTTPALHFEYRTHHFRICFSASDASSKINKRNRGTAHRGVTGTILSSIYNMCYIFSEFIATTEHVLFCWFTLKPCSANLVSWPVLIADSRLCDASNNGGEGKGNGIQCCYFNYTLFRIRGS